VKISNFHVTCVKKHKLKCAAGVTGKSEATTWAISQYGKHGTEELQLTW
jgi:hypothetical protein